MRAFDAARVSGEPGIRTTVEGERLEGRPTALPSGTLVVADAERPLALLFGAVASDTGVERKTASTMLIAIRVGGVPEIAVEEALWLAGGILRG